MSYYESDYDEYSAGNHSSSQSLLGSGWRPLYQQLDLNFLSSLITQDPGEFLRRTLDVCGRIGNSLGRTDHTWWANVLDVCSGNTRREFDEYWNFITPAPLHPTWHDKTEISSLIPLNQPNCQDDIAIYYALSRLRQIILMKILKYLGPPDQITQTMAGRIFYLPIERFTGWDQLKGDGYIQAYWASHKIWLYIQTYSSGKRQYSLVGSELGSWIQKAAYNLAVMLSGYQYRIGQVQSTFSISSFPVDVQDFTDSVQDQVLSQEQAAILVYGKPGTGKTAWTQAVAKTILAPLGYVIFILDHDAVEDFVPPNYLDRICLIVNEADNLAQNRATEAAQTNTKTEHILGLLDGTLHQSVIDEARSERPPRLVVLMTCNTIERMDPAVLRKGRVDLMYEFTHQFV